MNVRVATSSRFVAEDDDSAFYIDSTLHGDSVSFIVEAVVGGRRAIYTGREFFDAMMAHFGDRVVVIAAMWSDAEHTLRTNLDIFNEQTRRGASKTDAALRTKTCRWATVHGFTEVVGMNTTPDDFPGGYEQVLADFAKPTI